MIAADLPQLKKVPSFAPMSTPIRLDDPRVQVLSLSKVPTTLATRSSSSTDMTGKAALLRFVKTATPTAAAVAVGMAVALAAEAGMAEDTAHVEASELVAAALEDVAAMAVALVEEVASAAVAAVATVEAAMAVLLRKLLPLTHSLTLLQAEVNADLSSSFAICHGPPAMTISSNCSPLSAKSNALRSNTSPTDDRAVRAW